MAVTYNAYDPFLEAMGDNEIDMDGDTFGFTLHNAYTFDAAHNEFADVTGTEIATANGYTQQTVTLASVTWGQTGGTVVFDAANVSIAASGGSIGPATDCIVDSDTSVTPDDQLVFNIDFGAAETAVNGSSFEVNWNASGIFTGAFA